MIWKNTISKLVEEYYKKQPPKVFNKIGALKNLAKFTRKNLYKKRQVF